MAISSNYITLQKQIADELGDRQDLLSPLSDSGLVLSPIKNAIQSAIALLENERFYFNEVAIEPNMPNCQWATAQGQEFYSDDTGSPYGPAAWTSPALSSMAKIDALNVLINGQRYKLNPRGQIYLKETSVNPLVQGFPVDWSWAGSSVMYGSIPTSTYNSIRLYQIPSNTGWPVGVLGTVRAPALVNSSDANWWTEDAYDLTRSVAKRILAAETLHDPVLREEMDLAIDGDPQNSSWIGYRTRLRIETSQRRGTGRIRPTHF